MRGAQFPDYEVALDADWIDSFALALRAACKSPRTVRNYVGGVRAYLRWCQQTEPERPWSLSAARVRAFLVAHEHLADTTLGLHFSALCAFTRFLQAEGEIIYDPLAGVERPKVHRRPTPPLSPEEFAALLATCRGNSFYDRRDEAIMQMLWDTLLRASELAALTLEDVNLSEGVITVQRGKGGRSRLTAVTVDTARALGRYLRVRKKHRCAASPHLWLGLHGPLHYDGIYEIVRAGPEDRHCRVAPAPVPAHRGHPLVGGRGTESGLMAVASWSTRTMIEVYTGVTAQWRALSEFRRLFDPE